MEQVRFILIIYLSLMNSNENIDRIIQKEQSIVGSECVELLYKSKAQFQIIMEGQIAKFIIPMLKNQAVNTNSHQFILGKIKPSSHDCLLFVNFQPAYKPNHLFESIIPHFNSDHCHFTPAFVLPTDQKFYRENINFEKLKFDDRIQNSQEKNIIQANYRFSPPSNYCQLCKVDFQDYLAHTASQQHCNQITASNANLYIIQLADKFASFPMKTHKIVKKSRNQKGKRVQKKNSCKLSDSNIQKIGTNKNTSSTDSKNSNQSTNLISSIY